MPKVKRAVALYDVHYPLHHKPTIDATLDYLSYNKPDVFIFGGDQMSLDCISHHTKNKPLYRTRRSFMNDVEGFDREILTPINSKLSKTCEKIFIVGNHERFADDFIEEYPELDGVLDYKVILKLEERGWKIIPLGHAYKLGKLNIIHAETLTGFGNQCSANSAKKAVEMYAGNVLGGHVHTLQQYVKVSPVDHEQKWIGTISPCACTVNPAYLRNRPTNWVNGITLIDVRGDGNFNIFPVVVTKGVFTYAGTTYGSKK
jgi:Calcineurin-like phosphoesterase